MISQKPSKMPRGTSKRLQNVLWYQVLEDKADFLHGNGFVLICKRFNEQTMFLLKVFPYITKCVAMVIYGHLGFLNYECTAK